MKNTVRLALLATVSCITIMGGVAVADIAEDISDSCTLSAAGVTCYNSEGEASGSVSLSNEAQALSQSLNATLLNNSTSLADSLNNAIDEALSAMDPEIATSMQNAVTVAVTNVAESLDALVEDGTISLETAVDVLAAYMASIVQEVNDIDADAQAVATRTENEDAVTDIKALLASRYAQTLIESSIEVTTTDEDDDDTGVTIVTGSDDDDDDDTDSDDEDGDTDSEDEDGDTDSDDEDDDTESDDDDDDSSDSDDDDDDDDSDSSSSSSGSSTSFLDRVRNAIKNATSSTSLTAPSSSTTPGTTAFNVDWAHLSTVEGDGSLHVYSTKSGTTVNGNVENSADHAKYTEAWKCGDGTTLAVDPDLLKMLSTVQTWIEASGCTNPRLTLNSGYRSPSYNKKIGGATRSQHMQAKAGDGTWTCKKNGTGKDTQVPLTTQYDMGLKVIKKRGAGWTKKYNAKNFVHLDSRS